MLDVVLLFRHGIKDIVELYNATMATVGLPVPMKAVAEGRVVRSVTIRCFDFFPGPCTRKASSQRELNRETDERLCSISAHEIRSECAERNATRCM